MNENPPGESILMLVAAVLWVVLWIISSSDTISYTGTGTGHGREHVRIIYREKRQPLPKLEWEYIDEKINLEGERRNQ